MAFGRRRGPLWLVALVLPLCRGQGSEDADPPGTAEAKAAIDESRELLKAGKHKNAQDLLKQVLRQLELQPEAVEAQADVYSQLGVVYTKAGKEVEAISAFETSSELLHGAFGPADPRVSLAADRLAGAHVQAGDHAQAVPLYQRMLKAMRDGLGIAHPGYRLTLNKLAEAAMAAGKPKVAAKAYRETLQVLEQEPDGPARAGETAKAQVRLSRALGGTGAFKEALEHASAARKLYESGAVADADDMEHAFSVNAVAGVLEKLGRDEEAVSTMALAADLAAEQRSADDPLVAAAQKNLAGLKAHVARKQRRRAQQSPPANAHDEV